MLVYTLFAVDVLDDLDEDAKPSAQ